MTSVTNRIRQLSIISPKRRHDSGAGWEGFFPYYAGFPEAFATELLGSAGLPTRAVVLDPWNGSGTTTFSAARLNYAAVGIDLNPVMVVVGRARLLSATEADSLAPLGQRVIDSVRVSTFNTNDPLCNWFASSTAAYFRSLEAGIRDHLVGALTLTHDGVRWAQLSSLAATNYVALFSVARDFTVGFRSSNPTWLRIPDNEADKVEVSHKEIAARFMEKLNQMAKTLLESGEPKIAGADKVRVCLGDATTQIAKRRSADFILTSPPYCTRIDYTAATRVELALLRPLSGIRRRELRPAMIGSTLVPKDEIVPRPSWGKRCCAFLDKVKGHESRASSGYYYKTHLDYFKKMYSSLGNISHALRKNGIAVLVVQDSYYKEVHNDLAGIICEMGEELGLELQRHEAFSSTRSFALINSRARQYNKETSATESVLCFSKAAIN